MNTNTTQGEQDLYVATTTAGFDIALACIVQARLERLVDLADRACSRRLDEDAVKRAHRLNRHAESTFCELRDQVGQAAAHDLDGARQWLRMGEHVQAEDILGEAIDQA